MSGSGMAGALREAARVAKPNAPVVLQVWGRPEAVDLEAGKSVMRRFLPPPPPGAPQAPQLYRAGALEQIATDAGLTPDTAFDLACAYEYPDEATMRRSMLSAAGLAVLAGPDRVDEVGGALAEALAPYRTPSGGYRLSNEYHFLVARAPL